MIFLTGKPDRPGSLSLEKWAIVMKNISILSRARLTRLSKFTLGFVFGFVMAIAFHFYPEFWIDFFHEKLIEVVIKAILKLLV